MSLDADAVPDDTPAPTLGGRYQVGELIGRGGMADVYHATDRVLDRSVAVKILRDRTASEAERDRFTAEARTLAALSHPNLVTVLDAGSSDDRPYLVMELVVGPTLAQCTGEPMPIAETCAIAQQVADALAYAHDRKVVHRDVKPANVLLGPDGRVWLADFGIARLVDDAAHHTRTGMTIGSPAYLSPEQVRGETVTPAADVYSLGLVILEMLTGQRAYGGTPTEAALARLTRAPVLPAALPAPWRDLLTAMTATDPQGRPDSRRVAAVLGELAREAEPGAALTGTALTDTALTDTAPRQAASPDDVSTQAVDVAAQWTQDVAVRPGHRDDEGEPDAAATARVGRRRRSRLRPWMAVVAACVVAALAIPVSAALNEDTPSGADDPLPAGVEPELRDPLRDLHDAVNGVER
ncbi:serine/threonine-protein kinase [Nocardioides sp. SYSU DS0651]|uniref:serine/threonine-protein kinase n=1 Tax=Nocardioides sp. SYSU DS0651 TaxID=3415955 RepID=UPI003F4C8F91